MRYRRDHDCYAGQSRVEQTYQRKWASKKPPDDQRQEACSIHITSTIISVIPLLGLPDRLQCLDGRNTPQPEDRQSYPNPRYSDQRLACR